MAYATQDPWIMDGTVRENITIGRDYDAIWYKNVVGACGLDVDFTQLSNSDQTIVGKFKVRLIQSFNIKITAWAICLGDRGVQLSGGQRARIGLARALCKLIQFCVKCYSFPFTKKTVFS